MCVCVCVCVCVCLYVTSPKSSHRAQFLLYRLSQSTKLFDLPDDAIATASACFGKVLRAGGVLYLIWNGEVINPYYSSTQIWWQDVTVHQDTVWQKILNSRFKKFNMKVITKIRYILFILLSELSSNAYSSPSWITLLFSTFIFLLTPLVCLVIFSTQVWLPLLVFWLFFKPRSIFRIW